MNHLMTVSPRVRSSAYTASRAVVTLAVVAASGGLAACGGISDLTKERVSHSSVAVQQSQQTMGRSEEGAVELQQAKQDLEMAEQAVKRTDDKGAQRSANLAQLHAELAVAQSQSADARRAAAEVLASTEALRDESARKDTVTR